MTDDPIAEAMLDTLRQTIAFQELARLQAARTKFSGTHIPEHFSR
jgi:hypothetical protein